MRTIRPWLAALFALVLTLTGQSMAVARGANDAMGRMVICTGHGPVTVYVDARGAPTEAPHLCPECLAQGLSADAPAPFALPIRLASSAFAPWEALATARGQTPQSYQSRAPPAWV